MTKEQMAARLLATFVGELEEQVGVMNADLLALEVAPADAERLKSLFRVAHTLKGAARAAGVPVVEDACHELEGLLAQARDGKVALERAHFTLLFAAADALADAGRRLKDGVDVATSPLAALRADLKRGRMEEASALPPAPAAAPASAGEARSEVRVRPEKLDALLAANGQLAVTVERVAGLVREIGALHDFAAQWASAWRRTGPRVRLALERAGASAPVHQWIGECEENIRRFTRSVVALEAQGAAAARALAQASDDVADRVRRLRMLPFVEACETLPRVARDVAAAGGKDVRLTIAGGDVEMDRAVLDGLRDALVQLVRNAVDHGIEPRAARSAAGKPVAGTVGLSASLKGDRIAVTVSDDGVGLNVAAIGEQLVRRGLPVPEDEHQVARALFESGFSTRSETTAISGRGVGLDIVRAAALRIRGTVDVAWQAGHGTTFTIECPPTLASVRAVLVAVDAQVLAFPTTNVERLIRVRPEDVRHAEGRDVVTTSDGPVPLVALARLLPPLAQKSVAGPFAAAVLTAGGRRLAVAVDELLAEQDVVLRPLGHDRVVPASVSGAATLGSGRVAVILNPAVIIAAGLGAAGSGVATAPAAPAGPRKPHVLVVDDSITTRTLEQSILEAAGYEVRAAVDGDDAWRQLQEHGADLVVADIEMPRMDGFALTEAIRGSKRFKDLPVVLVTALEKPEYRARGLAVGADVFIGKSGFDQQNLIDTVRELLE